MKYGITRGVDFEQVQRQVPRRFHKDLASIRQVPGPYTLIIFSGSHDEVTLSPIVERALAEAPPQGTIVAVATGFTAEGYAALAKRSALTVVLGTFYWTDESYRHVRDPRPH